MIKSAKSSQSLRIWQRKSSSLEQIIGSSNYVLQNDIVYNNSSNQVSTRISNAVIQFNCIQGWTNFVDGNPRILWGTVDMGAYECVPPVVAPV